MDETTGQPGDIMPPPTPSGGKSSKMGN